MLFSLIIRCFRRLFHIFTPFHISFFTNDSTIFIRKTNITALSTDNQTITNRTKRGLKSSPFSIIFVKGTARLKAHVRRTRARRRETTENSMKKQFFLNLSLALLLCTGTTFAQRVDTVAVLSPSMHKTVKSVVVLPASYDQSPEKRYPVVYLLHGHGGNYAAYVNQTRPQLPQDASNMEFIAVCPDGGRDSWYWDSPADPKNRYETFVASELVKYIDKHYRTKADRTGRAITGFSMGGHGALWLAFRHPETFGACGSMSGGVDIRPFPDQWGMKRWLGEYADHPKVWDDYTVATQLYRLRPEPHVLGGRSNDWLGKSEVRRPAIIIDCGTDDFFYGVNLALHDAMLHNNIAHTFIVRPGSHNHDYWRNALEYQLLFFHNYFDREAQPQ